jgi:hypothetical protein
MVNVRIHDDTKERLDYLAGRDLSMDDVIKILLTRFIVDERGEDVNEGQYTIDDFDDDDEDDE